MSNGSGFTLGFAILAIVSVAMAVLLYATEGCTYLTSTYLFLSMGATGITVGSLLYDAMH